MLRDFIDRQHERLEDLVTVVFYTALLIVACDEIAKYERRQMLRVVEHG